MINIENLSDEEILKLIPELKKEVNKRGITQKIAINNCYGGFGLSNLALEELKELGLNMDNNRNGNEDEVDRSDPRLIQVIEKLGESASDDFANIEIVEIPNYGSGYFIEEYDGAETAFPK